MKIINTSIKLINFTVINLFKIIPKKLISHLLGIFFEIKIPKFIVKLQLILFIKCFKINIHEIKKSLNQFSNLQEFFTRKLKPDSRKISTNQNIVISPCDGFWGKSGNIKKNILFRIKNTAYTLNNILGNYNLTKQFYQGIFAVFYISPKNYHRFHMPIKGRILSAIHIPGNLWPVNQFFIKNISNLLCINERIVIIIKPHYLQGLIALVAIGATIVGKIKINFDKTLITNNYNYISKRNTYNINIKYYNKGDEIGKFELGSTILLISSKDLMNLEQQNIGTKLTMGTKIGLLRN